MTAEDPVIILPVEPDPVITLPVEPTLEVAFYVYKKLEPTLPAEWVNSGPQTLIASVPGDAWFTEFPGDLPAFVCGPGWGVQQDKVAHDGNFTWPEAIEYPHDNIGWPPIYAAQHSDLGAFVTVPECVVPVETQPPAPPVTPPMLADTGPADDLFAVFLFAVGVVVAGWMVRLNSRGDS